MKQNSHSRALNLNVTNCASQVCNLHSCTYGMYICTVHVWWEQIPDCFPRANELSNHMKQAKTVVYVDLPCSWGDCRWMRWIEPEGEARAKVAPPAGEMQPLTQVTGWTDEWSLNREAMFEPCRLEALTEAKIDGSNPPPADDNMGFCTKILVQYANEKH